LGSKTWRTASSSVVFLILRLRRRIVTGISKAEARVEHILRTRWKKAKVVTKLPLDKGFLSGDEINAVLR
jgi:hypothetical protein